MKLNTEQTNTVSTNVNQTESTDFTIGDTGMVLEILRNKLYSYPIRTLVQEVSCNARDANREAGRGDKPIDIIAPTHGNPRLTISDNGLGMSPDTMKRVFTQFGVSTKRNSDSLTGGFGIGAKSPWAYTDNFTIITRIDGLEYHYLAHIGTKKTGTLDLISTIPTDKPTGTDIIIAVQGKDIDDFHQAIGRATMFWSVKPNIKNLPPTLKQLSIFKPEPRLEIVSLEYPQPDRYTPSYRHHILNTNSRYVIVDEIPYELPSDIKYATPSLDAFFRQHKQGLLLMYANNGDVEVGANREALSNSKKTIDYLDSIARANISFSTLFNVAFVQKPKREWFTDLKKMQNFIIFNDPLHHGFTTYNPATSTLASGGTVLKTTGYNKNEKGRMGKNVYKANVTTNILYYLDEILPEKTVSNKIKGILGNEQSAVVLAHTETTNKVFLSDMKELGAIPISSLMTVRAKRRTPNENLIPLTLYRKSERYSRKFGGYNRYMEDFVDLTKLIEPMVYFTEQTLFQAKASLLSELGFTVCFLENQKHLPNLQANIQCISSEDGPKIEANLTPEMHKAVVDKVRCKHIESDISRTAAKFLKSQPTINDLSLKSFLELAAKNMGNNDLSYKVTTESLMVLFPNLLPYPLEEVQRLSRRYPLLFNINSGALDSMSGTNSLAKELEWYVNNR